MPGFGYDVLELSIGIFLFLKTVKPEIMKRQLYFLIIAVTVGCTVQSCEYLNDLGSKDIIVATVPATSVTSTSALCGGIVRTDGGSSVTSRGVCWSIVKEPSVNLSTKTSDSTGTVSFSMLLTDLLPNTVYYIRAFAESGDRVIYGNESNFKTTQPTIPSITSLKPDELTASSALCGGNIINDGGSPIKLRGVCWSTSENPTTGANQNSTDSSSIGLFSSRLTGLTANKKYYARAFAVNNLGTAYGEQVSFTTLPASLPVINTSSPAGITRNTVTIGGSIPDDGGSSIISRGICWSGSPDPTADQNSKTENGSGIGNFEVVITGLNAGKIYYARAYAINSPGISYGNQVTFTTLKAELPSVSTMPADGITQYSAQCGGNVTSDGGEAVTARGICWSISENPTVLLSTKTIDGAGTGLFRSGITGLKSNTTYFVRAYASGNEGTAYGNQTEFKTPMKNAPVVITGKVSYITPMTAMAGGTVISEVETDVIERGVCWSTEKNPSAEMTTRRSAGSGSGAFTCTVSRLEPSTTYYLRAYAINSDGIYYGAEISFTTIPGSFRQAIGMSNLGTGNLNPELINSVPDWHYFAFTKSSDRKGKIYIDGNLAGESDFVDVPYIYSSLFIGAGYSNGWSGFYKGWLDELRISNIVRSAEEIHKYYNSNMPFSCDDNTYGLFHFNEGDGAVITTSSGTTGKLYNGVRFTEGKFSSGLYFDGIDDKGDCNLNIPENNITIEFWAKPEGIQDATIIQPFGLNNSNIYFKVISGN
jgi:hypothetical protein